MWWPEDRIWPRGQRDVLAAHWILLGAAQPERQSTLPLQCVCVERKFTHLQAMRFPLNAHRKDIADAEGAREREKELAKEIQDGEIDEEDALGGDF